jgi:hypothetical protein
VFQINADVRHDCDERDQTKFGYDRHDGAWFASHNAADTFSGVKISHRFVKQAVETPNGLKEAWSLKIDGEKITDNKNISVIWYVNTHKHPEVQQVTHYCVLLARFSLLEFSSILMSVNSVTASGGACVECQIHTTSQQDRCRRRWRRCWYEIIKYIDVFRLLLCKFSNRGACL